MDSSLGINQSTISGIIPSVTGYYINQTVKGYQVTVTISDQHEKDIGGNHVINNVGAIFVLAGYGVPAEMLEKMGVQSISGGRAKVKPHVGAAYLLDDTLDPSLLVGGIAMTSQKDQSDNTLPGMLGHLPNQLFHTVLYAMSNYRN